MLPRTIDKAKAVTRGDVGSYLYNFILDRMLFDFLCIDADEFLTVVDRARDDAQIESYARGFISKKSAPEIEAFNARMLGLAPRPGSRFEPVFKATRERVAPQRTDVFTWADLFDLEEGRDVPQRSTDT